jgi:CBS domain containing-hemolysin-like protein
MFVVRDTTTIEDFLGMLKEHNYSRVPVFQGTIDNITGIAFAHDLLQITDEDARTRTVSSIQRPAAFVPETKKGYELLREMQREKQHMRIVIDEYGAVAGLVTIEDLLEQIVGEIRDEHEDDLPAQEPQREPEGSWVVPGSFAVDQLGNLFDAEIHIPEEYEATTVGGLVSEVDGRIPLAGEVVMLNSAGLRMEVVASTDRRVDRVRVFRPVPHAENGSLEQAREAREP